MKPKLIPLLLTAALLLTCFAGCGAKEEPSAESHEVAEAAPAADITSSAEIADGSASGANDFQAGYEAYAPDDEVMRVNGVSVTWGEYYSWLYQAADQLLQYFTIADWDDPFESAAGLLEDPTYGKYVLSYAYNNAMQCAVIESVADQLDVTLTDAQQAEVDATMASYETQLGGKEALEEYLTSVYTSSAFLRRQTEIVSLFDNLYQSFNGSDGSSVSDEDALAYVRNQGYMYAKHILFKLVDDENQPLDEAAAAQKTQEAKDVLAKLQACTPEELPETFDSLMQEFSEDPGFYSYPDGYYFQTGEFVPEFEAAVLAMEENDLSDLVKSDYGYHIIYCPPMSTEHIIGYDSDSVPYGAKDLAAAALFDAVAKSWYENADVVFTPGFEEPDLNTLFKLK